MKRAALRTRLAVRSSHYTTYIDLAWRSGQVVRALPRSKMAPILKEPRSALRKAMARRAKNSHLGAFQTLPEHVLLSCLARLPREDHDAVADCSTGFRAVMRSERFLKARRAEEITEEALVVVPNNAFDTGGLLALVSGRVWRRLVPMPAELRIGDNIRVFHQAVTVIGSELFVVGGQTQNSRDADVSVYDAIDDEWFSIPLPRSFPRQEIFSVGCAGRLFVGGFARYGELKGKVPFCSWDAATQKWIELPQMPQRPNTRYCYGQLVAVAVGSEIFVLDRNSVDCFHVFDVETETWRTVDIPEEVPIPDANDYPIMGGGPVPWPNLCVDRTRIRVLIHDDDIGFDSHYIYDTVDARWLLDVSHDLAKQMACSESNRVYSVVEEDGWPWLNVYQRGTDQHYTPFFLQQTNTIEVPVAMVKRVCYMDMP